VLSRAPPIKDVVLLQPLILRRSDGTVAAVRTRAPSARRAHELDDDVRAAIVHEALGFVGCTLFHRDDDWQTHKPRSWCGLGPRSTLSGIPKIFSTTRKAHDGK
jgi:hypothetical protein